MTRCSMPPAANGANLLWKPRKGLKGGGVPWAGRGRLAGHTAKRGATDMVAPRLRFDKWAYSPASWKSFSNRRRLTPRSLLPTREALRAWSKPAAGS